MTGEVIGNDKVRLVPTSPADKRIAYEWSNRSDITKCMMGPPTFPDHPVPEWDYFNDDYKDYYFDGSHPELGRCFFIVDAASGEKVGIIAYNDIDPTDRFTEMDIWLSCEKNCGKGFGTQAITLLCEYLKERFGVKEVVMQPSARNQRGVHSYKKVGFVELKGPLEESDVKYVLKKDYYDSVILIKKL